MKSKPATEWGDFAKRHLRLSNGKPPTRRVGKRLILSQEIPGYILDNKPWVYEDEYIANLNSPKKTNATKAAIDLLEI